MKKYLLSILFFCVNYTLVNAQTFCTPTYQSGCSSMYIDGVQLDSLNTNYNVMKSYTLNSGTGCNAGNIDGYSANNVGTVKLYAESWYKFSISTQLDSVGNIGVFIDFDGDGVFNPTNELMQNANYSSNGTQPTSIYFTVPTNAKAGPAKMRIVTYRGGNYYSIYDPCFNKTIKYGEAEDYDITIVVPPKSVKNITTNPQTVNYVYQKSFDNKVLVFDIETTGITGNLDLNKLSFDILNQDSIRSKSLYTWYNNSWVNIQGAQIVKTINGIDINFSTPYSLPNSQNLFALFYDLDIYPARLASNPVDLDTKLTNVVINNTSQLDKIIPQVNKIQIVPKLPIFNTLFCKGNSLVQIFQMAQMSDNYNNRATDCNAVISSSVSPSACLGTTINAVFKATKSNLNAGLYIDWDGDLLFNSANEFINLGITDEYETKSITINVPRATADSNVFVRLLVTPNTIDKTSATGYFGFSNDQSESRDYFLRVKPATKADNLIDNIKYYQYDSLLVVKGDTTIKALTIVVEGDTASVLNLSTQSFNLNTGTTPNGNISKARLWAGNSLNDFSFAKQIGAAVLNPNGTYTFNTSARITSGKNYFFVTYDISNSAAFNTIVEAKLDNITFDNNQSQTASLDPKYTLGQLKVVEYIRLTNGISSTGCNILFTDNGGKDAPFTVEGLSVHEFVADGSTNTLKFKLNNLDLGKAGEEGRDTDDTLYIYDGTGTDKTFIYAMTQTDFWNTFNGKYEKIAVNGAFTFVFKSDANKTKQGWEAFISCQYNCSKFPLTTKVSVGQIKCAGEAAKVQFEILTSKTSKYKVSYFDWEQYKQVNLDVNKDNFELDLPTGGQGPILKITNENNCTLTPEVTLPDIRVKFSAYRGEGSQYPSCKIAKDGSVSYTIYFNEGAESAITASWKSQNTGKEIGTSNADNNKTVKVGKLMYDTLYNITFTNPIGECVIKNLILNSDKNVLYDSTTRVPQSLDPTTLDKSFVVGAKISSIVSVEYSDILPRLNYNFYDNIYPDSAKWIIQPINFPNKITNFTDTTQESTFKWNGNFSGKVYLKAQLFKSGCKGSISNPLNINIYPDLNIQELTQVNYNPKDSSIFPLQLKGTKPFILKLINTQSQKEYLLRKINVANYDLKLPLGEYNLVSVTDSFNLENVVNKRISVVADTITSLAYNIISQPACAGKKGEINFSSNGGKAPIEYKVYDILNNEITKGETVNLIAGNYYVKASDAAGFVSKNLLFKVENPRTNSIPIPTIIKPQSVFSTNVDSLIIRSTATINPFEGFKKINWNIYPSNVLQKSDTTLDAKIYLDNSTSGKFYLTAVAVDKNGCISDSSNKVIIERAGIAKFEFKDFIFYSSEFVEFGLNVKGTLPMRMKYQIGDNTPKIENITNLNSKIKISEVGKFKILEIVDKENISLVYETPNAQFTIDTITKVVLNIDSITCERQYANAKVTITGGKPDHTINVYDLDNKLVSTVTGINPGASLSLGNYKATVKDASGFFYKDTLYFDIKTGKNPYRNLKPVFTTKPADSIPSGTNSSRFVLNLPGYTSMPSYNWYYNNYSAAISTVNESEDQNTITWKNRFSGEVDIKVVAKIYGCKTDTGYFKLKIKPSVKLSQNANGDVLVKFFGTSPFRINYNFDTNPTKEFTNTLDSLVIPNTGASRIYVTLVGDANYNSGFGGDLSLATRAQTVGFKIYDAFSPNNDNINEKFVIDSLPSGTAIFQVIDRNGFIVYNNENYKNDWNGRDNSGEPVTDGVYYFVITIDKKRYSGPIEVRR